MANEYTSITIDLTGQGGTGVDGTLYAELFQTVTLANNDTVPPRKYSATVTTGAGSLVLPCTATAIKGTNAPFKVTFIPTSGAEVTLGRIIPTESATAVQLSDLLEVGATSAVPVTTYNVDNTTLTISPSIAHLQAMRSLTDGDRVLVQDVGIYRYASASTATADEATIVTPQNAVGRWLLEVAGSDSVRLVDVKSYGATADGVTADDAAITAAIAAAVSLSSDGQTPILYFPPAAGYATASPVAVPAGISVLMDAPIIYTGTADVTALAIGTVGGANIRRRFRLWVQRNTQSPWTDAVEVWRPSTTYAVGNKRRYGYQNYTVASITTGISASTGGPTGTGSGITDSGVTWGYTDAVQETNIGIKLINPTTCLVDWVSATNFTVGFQLVGDGASCAYNTVDLGDIRSNKIGVDVTCVNSGGYTNENVFRGGRFWVSSDVNPNLSRYGVRIATKDGSYTSNNGNIFVKPSFELNHSNCTGSAQGIGAILEIGQRNHILDARVEDTYAAVEWRGSCDGNAVDVAYSSLTVNALDYSTSANNIVTLLAVRVANTAARLIFSTPSLGGEWSPYTGSNTAVRRCSWITSSSAAMGKSQTSITPGATAWVAATVYAVGNIRSNDSGKLYQVLSVTGAATSAGAGGPTGTAVSGIVDNEITWGYIGAADVLQFSNTRALGVRIDTTNCKTFVVVRDAPGGQGGRVALVCYDGANAVLSGSAPAYARGTSAATISASASVGNGGYRTGSDSAGGAVLVTVRDEVKSIWIGVAGGSLPAIIRGFSIWALQTDANPPTVTAGYAGRTIDRLIATVVPASGTWEAGAVIWNDTPTAGGPVGWACVTAGTPGTWAPFGRVDLDGSATYDAPSIAAAGTTTTTITVTGAALGDYARVSFGVSLAGLNATAYVSASNTVTVVLHNPTAGAIDLASTTIRARVSKQ